MSKTYKWYKIADNIQEINTSVDGIAIIEVADKKICIAVFKEEMYATAAKCPHAGGNLGNGYIDLQGNIVCPLHRYKFSLATGRNVTGEGYYLKTYPVEKRENGIFLGIEEKGIFNWLK